MEKTTGDMRIRISGLSNGLHQYRFSAQPVTIGLDGHFRQPVEVEAALDKTSRQILLTVAIRTSGVFSCDRCLEDFEQVLKTEYRTLYVYNELEGAHYPPEEIQVLTPDIISIDVTEDVRQMVLLSVPLKLLCREDCQGLCPGCGVNLNGASCTCPVEKGDPRWEGLRGAVKN